MRDMFQKASTAMGCKVDDYRCYCTKRDFQSGVRTCGVACGGETEEEVIEWRNILCRK
jgi:hypothetical protein